MKKLGLLTLFLVLSIILFGCQQENVDPEPTEIEETFTNPKAPYPPEDAVENGDVVQTFGVIHNLDKFESFLKAVEAGNKNEIRITTYTIEGDPIFYNLYFDEKNIQYGYDNTQDKFGISEESGQTYCLSIATKESEEGLEYFLNGCASEIGKTFSFVIPSELEDVVE